MCVLGQIMVVCLTHVVGVAGKMGSWVLAARHDSAVLGQLAPAPCSATGHLSHVGVSVHSYHSNCTAVEESPPAGC